MLITTDIYTHIYTHTHIYIYTFHAEFDEHRATKSEKFSTALRNRLARSVSPGTSSLASHVSFRLTFCEPRGRGGDLSGPRGGGGGMGMEPFILSSGISKEAVRDGISWDRFLVPLAACRGPERNRGDFFSPPLSLSLSLSLCCASQSRPRSPEEGILF